MRFSATIGLSRARNMFHLVPLAAAVALFVWPGNARANVRWEVLGRLDAPYKGPSETAASAYLARNAASLGLESLTMRPAAERFWLDHTIIAYNPLYEGLVVFGSMVKVRVDYHGRVDLVVLDLFPISKVNATSPSITAEAAERACEALWPGQMLGSTRDTRLGLLPSGTEGKLVYRVDMAVGVVGHRHYVDASTGEVVFHHPRIFHSMGRVYPENPVATPETVDATLYNLDDESGPDNVLSGWQGMLEVNRHVSGTVQSWPVTMEHLALGDDNGNFLYDATDFQPLYDDPFTEVNLYYHLNRSLSYFTDVHGVQFSRKMYGLANYTENNQPYENAFFTPVTLTEVVMATGQGIQVDYGFDADVVMHEFGHYVIDEVAGLTYIEEYFDEWGRSQMPGALHEGLADYFSCTISGDGLLGEYSLGYSSRNLGNNTQICPDDMYGEPHMDGEVVGGTNWEIRQILGRELADDIIFGGLSLLTPYSTFRDFALGVQTSAQALFNNGQLTQGQLDQVVEILTNRGLFACGRYLEMTAGQLQQTHLLGFDAFGSMLGVTCQQARQFISYFIPGPFQYKVVAPDPLEHDMLQFNVQQSDAGSNPDLIYKVFVRQQEMVHYRLESLFGYMQISVPESYDYETEELTEVSTRVTLTPETTPPLVAGGEYYFALGYRNCPTTNAQVNITWADQPPQHDAGVDAGADGGTITRPDANIHGGGEKDSGCDCRVSSRSVFRLDLATIFMLALLLLAVWRRKSRHG